MRARLALFWKRLTCEHDYIALTARFVTDDFLGLGWLAWQDKCVKCGKIRSGWRPL